MRTLFYLSLFLFIVFNSSLIAQNAQFQTIQSIDRMPRFPGCEGLDLSLQKRETCANEKLFTFIENNLKYPVVAREGGIEGTVYVQFLIDSTGQLANEAVVVEPQYGSYLSLEALRIIKLMRAEGVWEPAMYKGKKINFLYTLPIQFVLTSDQKHQSIEQNKPLFYSGGDFTLIPPAPFIYNSYTTAYNKNCTDNESDYSKIRCTNTYIQNYIYSKLDKRLAKNDRVSKPYHAIELILLIDHKGSVKDFIVKSGAHFKNCMSEIISIIKNAELSFVPFTGNGKPVSGLYPIKLELMNVLKKKRDN